MLDLQPLLRLLHLFTLLLDLLLNGFYLILEVTLDGSEKCQILIKLAEHLHISDLLVSNQLCVYLPLEKSCLSRLHLPLFHKQTLHDHSHLGLESDLMLIHHRTHTTLHQLCLCLLEPMHVSLHAPKCHLVPLSVHSGHRLEEEFVDGALAVC